MRVIPLCQNVAAFITHLLYIHTLVGGGRIAVVYPEERTDFHFVAGLLKDFNTFRSQIYDLCRSQFLVGMVTQVDEGKALKRSAERAFFLSDDQRGSAKTVAGRIDSLRCHDQKGHGAVDHLLYVLDSFENGRFLIDQRGNHFGRIDIASAHFQEVGTSVFVGDVHKLFHVIDLTYGRDGKTAEM